MITVNTEMYMLFFRKYMMILNRLHISCSVVCVVCTKKKKKHFSFGNKTLELKNTSLGKGSQVKQNCLYFFSKTVTYLNSSLNFTNYFFALKSLLEEG